MMPDFRRAFHLVGPEKGLAPGRRVSTAGFSGLRSSALELVTSRP